MKKDKKTQLNPSLNNMTMEEVVSFLLAENEKLRQHNLVLEEAIKMLTNKKYGKSSEKTKDVFKDQLQLQFDEVEELAQEEIEHEDELNETVKVAKKVGRKKPSQSNANLEVEEITYPMDDLLDLGYKLIGEKTIEKYRHQPARVWIERHIYPVYEKELEDGTSDIISKYQGHQFLAKSPASSELVASIMNDKYGKALPLYRIEQAFENIGADISRQTMSNWLLKASDKYLSPIYDHMKADLITHDIIHADETRVQVLNHQDGSDNIQSTMWLYRSGHIDDNIIVYDYKSGRKQEYAESFLEGFKGYLQTDGYQVYKNIANVTQVGCLANSRRKFTDALKTMGKKTEGAKASANILKIFSEIFTKDRKTQDLSLEDRQKYRIDHLTPLFDKLYNELNEASKKFLPKSAVGKAITYNLNQFESFKNVLLDPRLELTNNRAERAIKPFVIGRKNWLFSNTTKGAKQSSIMYSVIQSAKENGLKVEPYLTFVFDTLSELPQEEWDEETLKSLMPHGRDLPNRLFIKGKTRK